MAVPSSGQLREYADIGVEIGVAQSNVSLRGMSQTAGFSSPDAMSEFYGYSSSTVGQLDILGDGSCIAAFNLDNNLNNLAGGAGTGVDFTYQTGLSNQSAKGDTNYSASIILNGVPARLLTNTVSFYFKRPSGHTYPNIRYIFYLSNGLHTWIGFNTSGLLQVATFDGVSEFFSNGISINNDQWYHFALVSNGGTKSIYLNGANYQDYFKNDYNTQNSNRPGTANTSIYNYAASSNPYTPAGHSTSSFVEQVRIFDKALSAIEVNTVKGELSY